MYLVLGFSRIVARFAPYSSSVRFAFTGIALCAVLICWFFGPYQWMANYNAALLNQINTIEQSIEKSYDNRNTQSSLVQQIQLLESKLNNSIQRNDSSSTKFFKLIAQAQAAHLYLKSCSYQYEKEKKWGTKQGIACSLEGTFEQFNDFFNRIKNQSFMNCKELSINRQQNILCIDCLFETIRLQEGCCV